MNDLEAFYNDLHHTCLALSMVEFICWGWLLGGRFLGEERGKLGFLMVDFMGRTEVTATPMVELWVSWSWPKNAIIKVGGVVLNVIDVMYGDEGFQLLYQ